MTVNEEKYLFCLNNFVSIYFCKTERRRRLQCTVHSKSIREKNGSCR